jgi:hypothetical protein
MVTDPLVRQQPVTFSATKLPLLLRAIADPEGNGQISAEDSASIKQVETNLSRYRKTGRSALSSSDDS